MSNFIEITLRHGCSPVHLLYIFRTPFPKNTSGWLLLVRFWSVPIFANLVLHDYENKWIKKVQKNDIRQARRFSKIFRFIDDLNALNNGGEFEQSFKEIYPPELILKMQNVSNNKGSFLNLFDKIGKINFPFSSIIREMTSLLLK